MAVDQVTYLDPHDFNQGLGFDYTQRLFELGPRLRRRGLSDVAFTDVYYQTPAGSQGVRYRRNIPGGRPIPGAYNRWSVASELAVVARAVNDHSWVWEGFYLATCSGRRQDCQ